VIAVGAGAAVLGDNLGYWIGRRGGRALLVRGGPFAGHRRRAVAKGDAFFTRHGGKTVFLGRWVPGVRVVAAVLAGASAMPWRRFVVYNAAGALAWAGSVVSLAAAFGLAGAWHRRRLHRQLAGMNRASVPVGRPADRLTSTECVRAQRTTGDGPAPVRRYLTRPSATSRESCAGVSSGRPR
jgi:membrane protein DedA with SNARE-associated domain